MPLLSKAARRTRAQTGGNPKGLFKPGKRIGGGPLSAADKAMITQFALDQPREVTPKQISQLAQLTRRSPAAIKRVVEGAREAFAGSAETYVDIHLRATQGAEAKGDYETAAKAAQWAMTNVAFEGVRVVDRAQEGNAAPKVLIGIKLGGLTADTRGIAAEAQVLPDVGNTPDADNP